MQPNAKLWSAVAVLAAGIGVSVPSEAAELGDKDDAIKLAMLEWTGQHVTTHVAGHILQRMGYTVEYITAGTYPHFSGLAEGQLHGSLENWLSNVGDIYPKVLAEGKIEELGKLNLETKEGWVYPKYVEELCPGLPDWTALNNPDCAKALSTPETYPKGRLLDYPAEWGARALAVIEDNNINLESVPAGTEGTLVAELEAAVAAKKPLIMMFWAPHYALAHADVAWVNLPPCQSSDSSRCLTAPTVVKDVWSGFSKKWPAAYEFLKQFEMHAKDQELMMYRIDKNSEDIDTVTKEWVDQNETIWKPWVDTAEQ